ncbi:hypothetical protein [Thermobrachium celere]|uniref:hypothetical protein n=1 Tax=Thermobrachium celere TaxID=53422 RepID=UPI001A61C8D2|nr:hypothetical protein TCEA9_22100 [Thermobrachium celere]
MIIEAICSFLDGLFLLAGYITNGSSFPKPLTEEEEKKLFYEFKNGNQEAKAELITRNLRLVAHIIKKIWSYGKRFR